MSVNRYPFDGRPTLKYQSPLPSISPLTSRCGLIVERTFAWLGRSRRLSKDDEGVPETSETLIRIVMIHLTLKRLTR